MAHASHQAYHARTFRIITPNLSCLFRLPKRRRLRQCRRGIPAAVPAGSARRLYFILDSRSSFHTHTCCQTETNLGKTAFGRARVREPESELEHMNLEAWGKHLAPEFRREGSARGSSPRHRAWDVSSRALCRSLSLPRPPRAQTALPFHRRGIKTSFRRSISAPKAKEAPKDVRFA